jgi:hypothetical protein
MRKIDESIAGNRTSLRKSHHLLCVDRCPLIAVNQSPILYQQSHIVHPQQTAPTFIPSDIVWRFRAETFGNIAHGQVFGSRREVDGRGRTSRELFKTFFAF